MKARYYIYRNLRTKGFSVRYRGKVVSRPFTFMVEGVEFKVNELGRQKVIQERQKNVHAFVIVDKYEVKQYPNLSFTEVDKLSKITYNPYTNAHFVCDGKRIDTAKVLAFQNGQCFLIE